MALKGIQGRGGGDGDGAWGFKRGCGAAESVMGRRVKDKEWDLGGVRFWMGDWVARHDVVV